jgi:effector-binding domain-containing protein
MSYHCEVVHQLSQPVLSIRTRTSQANMPETFGNSFSAIVQYLTELGEHPKAAPFAAYYNMDMEDLDVEIGFPIFKGLPEKGPIKSSEIPAGEYAACTHTGPYNEIGLAYQALTDWTQANGYLPTGVAYEYYLNDPTTTPPQELQTRVVFPVKPGG